MAARRLILILIVLMLASTIAAALAPTPDQQDEGDDESVEAPAAPSADAGRVLERRLDAGDERAPREIALHAGERLALTVAAGELGEVRIPRLGLRAVAGPGSPARFDILGRRGDAFAVEFEGRTLARVRVSREPAPPADGRASPPG